MYWNYQSPNKFCSVLKFLSSFDKIYIRFVINIDILRQTSAISLILTLFSPLQRKL